MKQRPGQTPRDMELEGQEVSPVTHFFDKERKASYF